MVKGMMPAFGKNKMLNATELAQVITYTRNALGNKVGDEIQPKAVDESLGGPVAKTDSKPAVKVEEKVVSEEKPKART